MKGKFNDLYPNHLMNLVFDIKNGVRAASLYLHCYLSEYAKIEFWRIHSERSYEVEDTVQDTCVKMIMYVKNHKYDGVDNENFLKFSKKTLKNINIDIYRRTLKRLKGKSDDPQDDTDDIPSVPSGLSDVDDEIYMTNEVENVSNDDDDIYFSPDNFLQRQEDLETWNAKMFSHKFDLNKEAAYRLMDLGDYSRKEILEQLELRTELDIEIVSVPDKENLTEELQEYQVLHIPVTVEHIAHWASQVRIKLNIHNTNYKKGDERNKRK